jgi:menaquinone-dependent protoporphyrinogen oxidase
MLVTYATESGSTAEVAEAIGSALREGGASVDVRKIEEVGGLDAYEGVVVGGPMIMGWHPDAVNFLARRQDDLRDRHVACFMTALSLTAMDGTLYNDVPVFQDPDLAQPPKRTDRLSFKERYSSVPSYLRPLAEKAPQVKPVGVAFFGGKLDYGTLNIFQRLFVRILVGAEEADTRNWDAIRSWVEEIRPTLVCG